MKLAKFFFFFILLADCNSTVEFGSYSHGIGKNEYTGELNTEEFEPDSSSIDLLDIFLIIDKSGSMSEERITLARKLDSLLDSIKGHKWQIAVATTDSSPGNACFYGFLTPDIPNYQSVYRDTINSLHPPGCPNGTDPREYACKAGESEEAIKMAIKALKGLTKKKPGESGCNPSNPENVRRPNSAIAVIIVTDEEHQCDENSSQIEPCRISDLYNYLDIIRIPHKTARVYGFFNEDNNRKFLEWKDEAGESIFSSVVSVRSSEEQYASALKNISQDLGSIFQSKYKLEEEHDGEASEVVIFFAGGSRKLTSEDYGIRKRELIIVTHVPKDTYKVIVTYSYGGSGK